VLKRGSKSPVSVAHCVDLSEGETCSGHGRTRGGSHGSSRTRVGSDACGASVQVLSLPHGHNNHGELAIFKEL